MTGAVLWVPGRQSKGFFRPGQGARMAVDHNYKPPIPPSRNIIIESVGLSVKCYLGFFWLKLYFECFLHKLFNQSDNVVVCVDVVDVGVPHDIYNHILV